MNSFVLLFALDRLAGNASAIRQDVLSAGLLDKVGQSALALALFFFVYVLFEVSMKLLSGQQFPWMDIIKPMMLILVVVNWSALINTVDTVGNYLNDNVTAAFNSEMDRASADNDLMYSMEQAEALEKKLSEEGSLEADPSLPVSDDSKTPNKFGAWLKGAFSSVLGGFSNTLNFGAGLFVLVKKIVGDVLAVLSQFYLIILSLLGPFAFAFAIVPSMNRISQWIGTYLQYWLWVPLINIVESIMAKFSTTVSVLRGDSGADVFAAARDTGDRIMDGGIMYFLDYLEFSNIATIASIFLLLSIPKLARLVIHSGEDVLSGNLGRFAGQAISTGVSVATGGARLPKL